LYLVRDLLLDKLYLDKDPVEEAIPALVPVEALVTKAEIAPVEPYV